MDKLELKALGKINLGLDILGRRENGYHDVRMVMQTVYLYGKDAGTGDRDSHKSWLFAGQ